MYTDDFAGNSISDAEKWEEGEERGGRLLGAGRISTIQKLGVDIPPSSESYQGGLKAGIGVDFRRFHVQLANLIGLKAFHQQRYTSRLLSFGQSDRSLASGIEVGIFHALD
jgi:hypothetical protein